jgi:uncharacterized protein (TIGR02246 family)
MAMSAMEELLGRWKAAFDGHDVDGMASLFAEDALFQGFGAEVLVGREAVRGYYAAVPANRSADVTPLHAYTLGEEVAGGFAAVTFGDTEGWSVPVSLSLVLERGGSGWLIRQYHVSRVGGAH